MKIESNPITDINRYKQYQAGTIENVQNIFEYAGASSRDNILEIASANISQGIYSQEEGLIISLLANIGIKPSNEDIKFIKENGYNLSRIIENIPLNLEQIMVNYGEIADYIKKFIKEGGTEFFNKLSLVISDSKKEGTLPKELLNPVSNLLKGLFIRENNNCPFIFIPVPLYFHGQPYHGEVWLESNCKDREESHINYIYLFVNAPSGRIEASIKYIQGCIDISIFCKRNLMPAFYKYAEEIKKSISSLGVIVTNFLIKELDRDTSFLDLMKKYLKPFTSLDVKV